MRAVGESEDAMTFRYKDLLVTVLPPGLRAADCTNDSVCGGACSNQHSDCPGGCSNAASDFHTTGCNDWRINPADFRELQVLLRHASEQVDLVQAAGRDPAAGLPQDAEERELLAAQVEESVAVLQEVGETDRVEGFAGAFRVRDLLVSVLPGAGAGCDAGVSSCPGGCSGSSTKFPRDPSEAVVLPPIEQVHALLQYALARTEAAMAERSAALTSREQAEGLTGRLKGLAEDLRTAPTAP